MEFPGFKEDFFAFFEELRQNNNRPWFHANKARYHESVVGPIGEFIICLAPRLRRISPHYVADPKPHGGSMFRIYRDTRFSKDKTPYKTHAGIHFRHRAGRDAHAPGFYLHLSLEGLRFGGGIWCPPGPELGRIRDFIAANPRAWARIRNAKKARAAGGIRGDSLLRPPRGFDPGHEHIGDLKRKSFYILAEAPPEALCAENIVERADAAMRTAAPLTRFICDALELPFDARSKA